MLSQPHPLASASQAHKLTSSQAQISKAGKPFTIPWVFRLTVTTRRKSTSYVVHRAECYLAGLSFDLGAVAVDAWRGGHIQALGGTNIVTIMNPHKIAFVIIAEPTCDFPF